MESSKETGCQAREGPILCINNCGFFGSAATMNMCSKCHKDMVLKHQQAQFAAASIENMVNGSSNTNLKEPLPPNAAAAEVGPVELKISSPLPTPDPEPNQSLEGGTKPVHDLPKTRGADRIQLQVWQPFLLDTSLL